MALSAPVDREFVIRSRGYVRDKIVLANFREGLRNRINPETGAIFTDDEIQRATRPKSRWYIGAQAVDDYDQGEQRRGLFLNDQIRIERASSSWLTDFHGRLEGETYLAATGSSGPVTVQATPGVIVLGSTTIGDPSAYTARDPAGNRYQVFTTETVGVGGTVTVTMVAISTGAATNLLQPTLLTWETRDPSMVATAAIAGDFSGGTDKETDADFASRLAGLRKYRPGAGNDSSMRSWARKASNAIEDAFVYPTALYAGSTLVALTQKRAGVAGPLARVPSAGTLARAIGYLTPPGSVTVPGRALVLVTVVNAEASDGVVRLAMQRGTTGGWSDAQPWPSYHATTPQVTTVTSNTDFRITCPADATLPGALAGATLSGVNAPRLMLWNALRTEFESLAVASVQDLGGNVFRVLLSAPPSFTLALTQLISPDVARRSLISQAISDYFDELGPGELIDVANDIRGGRCQRFPADERPSRAGAVIATRIIDALGGSSADGDLASLSLTSPSLPTIVTNGPNMLTAGRFAVYEI
jgi:hypothetical protein